MTTAVAVPTRAHFDINTVDLYICIIIITMFSPWTCQDWGIYCQRNSKSAIFYLHKLNKVEVIHYPPSKRHQQKKNLLYALVPFTSCRSIGYFNFNNFKPTLTSLSHPQKHLNSIVKIMKTLSIRDYLLINTPIDELKQIHCYQSFCTLHVYLSILPTHYP